MICDKYGYPVELEVKVLAFAINRTDRLTRKAFNEKVRQRWGSVGLDRARLFWRNRFFGVSRLRGVYLTGKGNECYNNMNEELTRIKKEQEKAAEKSLGSPGV